MKLVRGDYKWSFVQVPARRSFTTLSMLFPAVRLAIESIVALEAAKAAKAIERMHL
jgi:hypothetical protein